MELIRQGKKQGTPKVGDVVGIQVEGAGWLLGRVVSLDAHGSPFGDTFQDLILLYVYDIVQQEPLVPGELPPDRLLFPPMMITREPWAKGYVTTLVNRPLGKNDTLKQHCFEAIMFEPTKYFDEIAKQLRKRIEPCGILGIVTLAGLEEQIVNALQARA